jgi:hypothetical protein
MILSILLLAVVLLMIVLFVPVTYRVDASRQEQTDIKATAGWLFQLLSIRYQLYIGSDSKVEQKLLLRILGIPVHDFLKPREKKKKPRRKTGKNKQKKRSDLQPTVTSEKTQKQTESNGAPQEPSKPEPLEAESKPSQIRPEPTKRDPLYAIRHFCDKIKNIWTALKKLWKKKNDFLEFWNQEEHQKARSAIWKELRYLWKKSRPRRLEGQLHFGFEDPASTGMCMGALSMLYAWYPKKFLLKPDFEQKILEGKLLIKGRIQICTLGLIFWHVWFNQDIRRMYEHWQQI